MGRVTTGDRCKQAFTIYSKKRRRAFTDIPTLSQTNILGPNRAPLSPSPSSPKTKERGKSDRKKDKGKGKGKYVVGHPPHPRFPSSGGLLVATVHPALVSRRKSRTASVAFSFRRHLTEGALGCFHPHAFQYLSTSP